MGNRPKYWCKRRVRLNKYVNRPGFCYALLCIRFTTFFTKSLHKNLPVTWALAVPSKLYSLIKNENK
jgi:hypothetical protein